MKIEVKRQLLVVVVKNSLVSLNVESNLVITPIKNWHYREWQYLDIVTYFANIITGNSCPRIKNLGVF